MTLFEAIHKSKIIYTYLIKWVVFCIFTVTKNVDLLIFWGNVSHDVLVEELED